MNADEIVGELRESCTGNEFAPPMVTNRELTAAADLIESLQAQLVESQRREKAAVECVEEVEYSLATSKFTAAWAAIRQWRGRKESE